MYIFVVQLPGQFVRLNDDNLGKFIEVKKKSFSIRYLVCPGPATRTDYCDIIYYDMKSILCVHYFYCFAIAILMDDQYSK